MFLPSAVGLRHPTYATAFRITVGLRHRYPTWSTSLRDSLLVVVLVLQRRFKEECPGMHEGRLGAWHGSAWPVRYYPAYPRATAAVQPARTVPGAPVPGVSPVRACSDKPINASHGRRAWRPGGGRPSPRKRPRWWSHPSGRPRPGPGAHGRPTLSGSGERPGATG